MCETQHTSTNSRKWREFGWKNLISFFTTPPIKNKQLHTKQQCWEIVFAQKCKLFLHFLAMWKDYHILEYILTLRDILGYEISKDSKILHFGLRTEEVKKWSVSL